LKKFIKWWLPVVVWMSVIFVGSSLSDLPEVGDETADGLLHRAAHILEFAVLGGLTLRAVSQDKPITKRAILVALIVSVLYSVSDEFHQRFTPGRSSDGSTVLLDVAGGLMGVWAYRWWGQRITRAAVGQHTAELANQRASVAMSDPES
jgi:VanZ family protein